MSRSMALLVKAYLPPDYFDLTIRDIAELEIKEKFDKSTCIIAARKDASEMFKGFKLTDHPQINICCDITFFPSSNTGKYVPRLTFKKVDNQFATKDQKIKEKVIINLDESNAADNLWKMIGFLSEFKSLVDIGDFDKSYKVLSNETFLLEFDDQAEADKVKLLSELMKKSDLSEEQIENVLKQNREVTLKHFKRLLTEPEAWKEYQAKYGTEMRGTGQEAVWHHFLKKHHWLLGLNVDIRFIRDLIPEGNVGVPDTTKVGSPNADFIGIRDYTTLIELKTPKTKIFTETKKSTARANTWSFTDDFIDGVSQCLGQKFDWDKSHKVKNLVKDGEILDQNLVRTVDPKSIFLIGNRSEFPESSRDTDVIAKRDTFERFRRNLRNTEILTFDELYERAYFIVYGEQPPAA